MQIEPQTLIETPPEIPGGFVAWIIGGVASAVIALFGFVKWLVGIQVKDVAALRKEVSDLKGEVASNATGDEAISDRIQDVKTDLQLRIKELKDDLKHDIKRIENRIGNHIETRLKDMEKEITRLKSK